MKIYKSCVEDLTCTQARQLVIAIRQILWPMANVTVPWSGNEIEAIANEFARRGLDPTQAAIAASYKRNGG